MYLKDQGGNEMNLYDEAIEENKLMCDNHIQLTKEKYSYAPKVWERRKTHYTKIEQALTCAKKEHELLELYQSAIDLMVCVPQNDTYHYLVRYTDDVKFNSILNQINNKKEEMK